MNALELPLLDDLHIHLRQDTMMANVVPWVRRGGVGTCMVMPNLTPPVSTTEQALAYRAQLQSHLASPNDVLFLMSLYLGPTLTREEVLRAHAAGIRNVKSYPRGVTTNSEAGIESYAVYAEVFRAMEECGMILNLHGEVPSDSGKDICVMNAEMRFLENLRELHRDFPRLRIILEHASTREAVEMVKSLGDTVACTITVHHLELTVDDWAGQAHHFCKPVAKYPHDRKALRDVIIEGHPRFFLGSDSAPHPRSTKECAKSHAGVYTTPYLALYLAHVFEGFGALNRLRDFSCTFGRRFYGLKEGEGARGTLKLVRRPFMVPMEMPVMSEAEERVGEVVPFLAGRTLNWSFEE